MPTIKVLIVDDNAKFIHSVKKILSKEQNIEVIGEAREGHEAILKAKEFKPDIVLMDVRMPEMGGIEATRRISQIMPETKIIFLTIYDMEEYREAATAAGADDYIIKKSMNEELIPAIIEAFEPKHA